MKRLVSAFFLLLIIISCGGGTPASPTPSKEEQIASTTSAPTAAPTPTTPAPTPSPTPNPEPPENPGCEVDGRSMVVLDWDEDRGYLKLRNDLKCAHDYGVAIYVPIVGTSMEWSNQKLFSSSYKKLGPGEAYEFKAKLPSCGPFQADPTHTLTSAPEKPDFGVDGRYLLNIYAFGDNYGDAGNCNPPAPPPPPTPAPPVPPNPPTPPTPPPTPPAPTCQAIDPVLTKKEALTSTHLEVVITASWKGGLPASLEYSDAPSVRLTVPGTVNRSYIRTSTEQTFTVLLRPETGLATLHCPTSPISIKVPALPPPPPPPPTPVCAGPWVYTGANPFSLPNSGNATELAHVRTYVSSLLVGPVKSENIDSTEWVSDGNYPVVLVKSAQVNWLYTNVTKGQILLSPAANQNGKLQGISHISRFTCP